MSLYLNMDPDITQICIYPYPISSLVLLFAIICIRWLTPQALIDLYGYLNIVIRFQYSYLDLSDISFPGYGWLHCAYLVEEIIYNIFG
jgi:hypothetical protein